MAGRKARRVEATPEQIRKVTGSTSQAFSNRVLNAAMGAVPFDADNPESRDAAISATFAALRGAEPRSELEGMLMAQMIAVHETTMACLARAQTPDQSPALRDMNLKHGVKLSRTFAQLLETLDRHRGKGQQKITVVHQQVHAEACASVNVAGTVDRGEGAAQKSEDQPHEHETASHTKRPALSFQPALWCQNPFRCALPGARHAGQDPLPSARR